MALEDAVALLWLGTIYTFFKLSEKVEIEEIDIFFRMLAYIHAVGGLGAAYLMITAGDLARLTFAYVFVDALVLFLLFLLLMVRYIGRIAKLLEKMVKL